MMTIEDLAAGIQRLVREHIAELHRSTAAALEREFASSSKPQKRASERLARRTLSNRSDPEEVAALAERREACELILFFVDAWSALPPASQPELPRFVVTHGAVPVMEDVIDGIKEGSAFRPVLMDHMEGISPIVQDPDNFAAFNIRYKIRFDDGDALTISSLTYDSAMVLLLGAVASGQAAPTGAQLAEAMPLLVDKAGTPISFGGAGLGFIQAAIDTLEGGGSVDLKGVSGELDFDLATCEVRTDLIGWDLVPRAGDEFTPVLTAARRYTLDPAPANGGTWTDL